MKYQQCGKRSQGQPLNNTSRLLMGPEQMTRPQTLQVYDDDDSVGSVQNNTYRNIILPISCGFKTWCVTLTRSIGWGCMRIRCWERYLGQRGVGERWCQKKKMHKEELHHLYCLLGTNRVTGWRRLVQYGTPTERRARHTGFRWGNLKDLYAVRRILLQSC